MSKKYFSEIVITRVRWDWANFSVKKYRNNCNNNNNVISNGLAERLIFNQYHIPVYSLLLISKQ